MLKKLKKVIFKSKRKKMEDDSKIRLCGKNLYSTESVRYLRFKIGANLSCQCKVNDLSIKLNIDNLSLLK